MKPSLESLFISRYLVKCAGWLSFLFFAFILASPAANTFRFDLETIDKLLSGKPVGEDSIQVGDMLFRRQTLLALQSRLEANRQPRSAVKPDVALWPNGRVPYAFDPNVSAENRSRFLAACAEWKNVANVDFVSRTSEVNYVLVKDANDNSSYVGVVGGVQELHMFNWDSEFIICHELGHALGLNHEQCRSDRDSYIRINFENIESGMSYNFETFVTTNSTPYDFRSIMHYGTYAFSKNGLPTIVPAKGYEFISTVIGNRDQLSFYDKYAMAELYGPAPRVSIASYVIRDKPASGLPNNGNGRAEPGENNVLVFSILNSTSKTVSTATVSVSNIPTALSFSSTQSTAQNIAPSAVAQISIPFTVSKSANLAPEIPIAVRLDSQGISSEDTINLLALLPGQPPEIAPERIRFKRVKKVARRTEGLLSFVCKDSRALTFQIEYSGQMEGRSWSSAWTGVRQVNRRAGVVTYAAKVRVKTADRLQFRVRATNVYGNKVSKIVVVRLPKSTRGS